MRILITNDDSVSAAQLLPLIKWCQQYAHVTTVVPKYEQSGKSHSINIHDPFEIMQVELEPGISVWTVDSTPADCIRFAVTCLKQDFDLVLSGINRGFNLGRDAMYSGTFSAACEAAHQGIPAIAFSTSIKYYASAVQHLEEIFRFFKEYHLLKAANLYNVNIPVDPKGIRITQQGGPYFADAFTSLGNGLYQANGRSVWQDSQNDALDTDATMHGYISITPMTLDRTDHTVFTVLKSLNP